MRFGQTFAARHHAMPTQERCRRVPPTDSTACQWSGFDCSSLQEDDLPLDPRTWSRRDVARWVGRGGGLAERFPMNGKALCLMTPDMFAARVPGGGPALHRDFRRRLAKALTLQDFIDKISPK